jgi:hypothetical protein
MFDLPDRCLALALRHAARSNFALKQEDVRPGIEDSAIKTIFDRGRRWRRRRSRRIFLGEGESFGLAGTSVWAVAGEEWPEDPGANAGMA